MKKEIIKLLASFFYMGYFPIASGTFGTLGAVIIYYLTYQNIGIYVGLWVLITIIGFIVSGKMEKIEGKKDPGSVVIDEVSGMMIALFLLPNKPSYVIITFLLFRGFDMFKVYPANILEEKGGGFGIMMDDIAAGIYTLIVIQGVIYFL